MKTSPNPQGLLIPSPLRPEHTCSMRQYLFSVPQHAYINLTSSPPLIIPYQDLMLQHHYNHQRAIPNLSFTLVNIPSYCTVVGDITTWYKIFTFLETSCFVLFNVDTFLLIP